MGEVVETRRRGPLRSGGRPASRFASAGSGDGRLTRLGAPAGGKNVTFVSRALLTFGACCALAALATLSYAAPADHLAGGFSALQRELVALTAPGPWRWVLWGAAGSGALALSLSGARRWIPWDRLGGPVEFGSYEGKAQAAALAKEVAARVSRLLEHREGDVVRAFEEVVRGAVCLEASDVHLSPSPQGYRITYRVSGALHSVAELEPRWAQPFATRIKVLASLEIHTRRKSQDGRLVMSLDGSTVEARVSTLPTESGERVVLRLVRGSVKVADLASLGLSEPALAGLVDILAKPQGILFVTGPVGSGKTTTLYSALKYVAEARGKTTSVVTLEDPIEIELPFATQTQMHARAGRTFASTLRSVLRQDPNVLMVGEIRDRETAEIATQAGLTGHLILTTLHADSAAGPFARLIDMNIEPFAVASATVGSLSQRLVRLLCGACKRPAPVDEDAAARLRALGIPTLTGHYFEPAGCLACDGEGFVGRRPVTELLIMTPELRQAVSASRPTDEIAAVARQQGMKSLLSEGLAMAARGETSLAEVLRVAG